MKLPCRFFLTRLGFRVHAFFITTTPKIQHISKFTHPLWNTRNDSTDRSSTNEVWVTWTNPTSRETAVGKVKELDERAMIVDLRREFVKKRRKQADEVIDPVTVKVHEKKNGEVLEEDAFLKQYFVPPEGRGEGPGQSKKTALFLTLPNVQQPQLPVVRNAILVFLLIGSVPWCTFKCPDRNSDTALVPTICYEIKSSSFRHRAQMTSVFSRRQS